MRDQGALEGWEHGSIQEPAHRSGAPFFCLWTVVVLAGFCWNAAKIALSSVSR